MTNIELNEELTLSKLSRNMNSRAYKPDLRCTYAKFLWDDTVGKINKYGK